MLLKKKIFLKLIKKIFLKIFNGLNLNSEFQWFFYPAQFWPHKNHKYLIDVNKSADFTVFVSTWLMDLFEKQGLKSSKKRVILAGANEEVFNPSDFTPWDGSGKLKIVTHHWGANWNKGFDVYSKLDFLLYEKKWSEVFEFTYIGNLPKNFQFNNVKYVKPLAGADLAKELSKHNLYITASINEPSGNHHMEGGLCGLPLMYVDSGGITEN